MTCWKGHALTAFRSLAPGRASTARGIRVALVLVAWFAGVPTPLEPWSGPQRASAQATNVEWRALATPEEAVEATEGPKFNLTAGAFFPTPSSPDRVGFSLAGDFYYDFRLGPVVLAPGGRFSGYLSRDIYALAGFAILRTGLSLGPVHPYLMGGAGFGFIAIDQEVGVSYLGGGGLLLALRRRMAVGLEASYQGFTTTAFRATYLGASLQFSYN